MPDEPWDDPEWHAYVTRVRTEVAPMVQDSSIGVSLVPTSPEKVDVKFAVELGLMIMYDKPIILVCEIGTELSQRLRRVADAVVFGDSREPGVRDEIMDAIRRVDPDGG